MNALNSREAYRPSGRFSPFDFLGMLGFLYVSAGLLAIVAEVKMLTGWYFIFFSPLLLALAVTGMAWATVVVGRCRNPILAFVVGASAGLLILFGQHYLDMILVEGPDAVAHPERVPSHIADEMAMQVVVDVGRGPKQANVADPNAVGNWLFFSFGAAMLVLLPGLSAYSRSRRVYGELGQRWMKTASVPVALNAIEKLRVALPNAPLETHKEELALAPTTEQPHGELVVHFIPGFANHPGADPTFLTLKSVVPNAKKGHPPASKEVGGPWRLEDDEVRLLAARFPTLREPLGIAMNFEQPDAERDQVSPQSDPVGGAPLAEIAPVAEPYARQILSRSARWRSAAVPLGILAIAFASMIGGFIIAGVAGDGLPDWAKATAAAGGFVAFLGLLVFVIVFGDPIAGRVLHRTARHRIAERPDRWIDPDEPDLHFVQVVPRSHWGKVMLENASEIGFLQFDHVHGRLLYEGDHERWHIPAESLAAYEMEAFVQNAGQPGSMTFTYVVLKARLQDGSLWEAPVAHYPFQFRPSTNKTRRQNTERLHAEVATLTGQGAASNLSVAEALGD